MAMALDNADAFPTDPNRMKDNDKDGVSDQEDAFPLNSSETPDSNSDGIRVGDNANKFLKDAKETKDSDGNGIRDNDNFYRSFYVPGLICFSGIYGLEPVWLPFRSTACLRTL